MRLILLGTGPFAVPTLRALAASRHEVVLVVTRPPQGRNRQLSPIAEASAELGLEVWSPETVNAPEAAARLASLAADLLVVCDYGEILRPPVLSATRLGGINLHGSLLPKYRGAAPVQWAILRGETVTGNSVIQMTPGLDAGPLVAQQEVPIDPEEDAAELEARLAALGASLVLQSIESLERGTVCAIAQDASQSTKAPRLSKEQGAIDWSRSAREIKNQVRALRPWPRAYTFLHRDGAEPLRLNIDRVSIVPEGADVGARHADDRSEPGTVRQYDGRLWVTTSDGVLEILELQPAGKRAMPAADFLRGHPLAPSTRLGPA